MVREGQCVAVRALDDRAGLEEIVRTAHAALRTGEAFLRSWHKSLLISEVVFQVFSPSFEPGLQPPFGGHLLAGTLERRPVKKKRKIYNIFQENQPGSESAGPRDCL